MGSCTLSMLRWDTTTLDQHLRWTRLWFVTLLAFAHLLCLSIVPVASLKEFINHSNGFWETSLIPWVAALQQLGVWQWGDWKAGLTAASQFLSCDEFLVFWDWDGSSVMWFGERFSEPLSQSFLLICWRFQSSSHYEFLFCFVSLMPESFPFKSHGAPRSCISTRKIIRIDLAVIRSLLAFLLHFYEIFWG
jgi:hypothetical protein